MLDTAGKLFKKLNEQVPEYLKRILRDYLKNRRLLYQTCEGPKEKTVTAGAAQGSVL